MARLAEAWGWAPDGWEAAVLDFLIYDGWVDDRGRGAAGEVVDVRALVERVVADALREHGEDPDDATWVEGGKGPLGGDAAGLEADVVARAVSLAWERWPRRGPPPVPLRRPLNGRDLAEQPANLGALRAPCRPRQEFGGSRVAVPS